MSAEFGEFFLRVCLNRFPYTPWLRVGNVELQPIAPWLWRGGGTLTEGLQCCDVDVNAHMYSRYQNARKVQVFTNGTMQEDICGWSNEVEACCQCYFQHQNEHLIFSVPCAISLRSDIFLLRLQSWLMQSLAFCAKWRPDCCAVFSLVH